MQVIADSFALVGERMPLSLVVTASDAVASPRLVLQAQYLDGGVPPELSLSQTHTAQPFASSLSLDTPSIRCSSWPVLYVMHKTSSEHSLNGPDTLS